MDRKTRVKRAPLRRPALVLFALALTALSAGAGAAPSNKWRLQVSGGAESDGSIVIRILPKEGEPVDATVAIEKGMGENKVAKTMVEGLREQLSKDLYHIERDDGEDVLVKRRFGKPSFDLEIVSIDVKGVRINKDRE